MKLNPEIDVNKLDEYSKSNDIPKLHYQGNFSDFFNSLSLEEEKIILSTCVIN